MESQRVAAVAVAEELAHAQANAEAEATRANDLDSALQEAQAQVEDLTARAEKAEAEVARLAEDGNEVEYEDGHRHHDDERCILLNLLLLVGMNNNY